MAMLSESSESDMEEDLGSHELKFFDTPISFTFDVTGEIPATGQLCLIPQGITESTRIGRTCVIRQILVRLLLNTNPAAVTAGDAGYLALLLDTQCNGTAAAIADIYTPAVALGQAMPNSDNSERFTVLKSWRWSLQPASGVTTAWSVATAWIAYRYNCDIVLDYDSSLSTGALSTIRSNNVFLVGGSNSQDDQTSCVGNVRLYFSDE